MSKVFGYGECGCLYEVPSKEEFDALADTSCVFYRETVTVRVNAFETMVVLENDLFTNKCLVEIYGVKKAHGTPFFSGPTVCIPVSDNEGTKIDVIVKVVYLTEGNSVIKLVNSYEQCFGYEKYLTGEKAIPKAENAEKADALKSSVTSSDIVLTGLYQRIADVPINCLVYLELHMFDDDYIAFTHQMSICLDGSAVIRTKTLLANYGNDKVFDNVAELCYWQNEGQLKMKYEHISGYDVKVTKVTIINLA